MKNTRYGWAVALTCVLGFWGCSDEATVGTSSPACTGPDCNVIDPKPLSECGNSILEDGEACDDGNQFGEDGCSANCLKIEDGYTCSRPGKLCTKNDRRVCGDGILQESEACDDGNQSGGDGCSADCNQIEPNYKCKKAGKACVYVGPACGNFILDEGETCDDGNNESEDGCSSSCQTEEGYTCDSGLCWKISCGDGIQDVGEQCDPGKIEFPEKYGEYGLGADGLTLCNPNSCQHAHFCGDSIRDDDFGEECDLGRERNIDVYTDGSGCTEDCRIPGFCGDGKFTYAEGREKCDPSVPGGNPGCNNDCTPREGFACNPVDGTCKEINSIKCDTNAIESGEDCDQNGNGCKNCHVESGYKCIASIASPCTACSGSHTYANYPCCTTTVGQQCKNIAAGYGDGILDPDGYEECDDGNKTSGDGCSATGSIEPGFICTVPGAACTPICGDGNKKGSEECDDGNKKSGDGCTNNCKVEAGYYCKTAGRACELDYCGNGYVGTDEACDGQPGCGPDCSSVNSGYCYSVSRGLYSCSGSTCGNYILEAGEECDDGNTLGGDGCSNTCRVEHGYECPTGVACRPECGDGKVMWQIGEKCDLGPDNGRGKGCTIDCRVDTGFTCTDPSTVFPDTINLDVTYRDFIGMNESGSGNGYVNSALYNELTSSDSSLSANNKCARTILDGDKEWFNHTPNIISKWMANSRWLNTGRGFPDFQGFTGNLCFGLVEDSLDSEGKPVLTNNLDASCCGKMVQSNGLPNSACEAFSKATNNGQNLAYNGAYYNYKYDAWYNPSKGWRRYHMLCGKAFAKWYRDDSRINMNIPGKLKLTKESGKKYVYNAKTATSDQYFAPIDGQGFGNVTHSANNAVVNHNGNYTTEISTYFQYKGGEQLNFNGDDDLWVFINGKLFLDMGGYHAEVEGWNTLANGTCSSPDKKNGGTVSRKCDERYGIYENGLYELKVFHAEREASGSNFKLTLDGFINPSSVSCSSACGDGIVASGEECDIKDHTNDSVAQNLGCVNCKWKTPNTCGNGRIEGSEACDTGYLCKQDAYRAACAALGLSFVENTRCDETRCKYYDTLCGNGNVDAGEDCDSSSDPLCNPNTCKWYCGDGIIQSNKGEECDAGSGNNDDGSTDCTTKCKLPTCGDGIVSLYAGEICDDGVNNGTYGEGKCMAGCVRTAPFCGDGKLQSEHGEKCDLGKSRNTGAYGGCNADCTMAPRCGDGHPDTEFGEECDDDAANCVNCKIQVN